MSQNGMIILAIMIIAGFCPFLIGFIALYANYDVTYFLVDEVLPERMYRDMDWIGLEMLIRAGVIAWTVSECSRNIGFYGSVGLTLFSRAEQVCKTLILSPLQTNTFILLYRSTQILYGRIYMFIEILLYVIFFVCFWVLVASICGVVIFHERLPTSILAAAILVTVLLCAVNYILVPRICRFAETALGMKIVNLKRAEVRYSRRRTRWNKWNLLRCRSLRPIRIRYGHFMEFGRDFKAEYVELFIARCSDAILSTQS